MKYLILAAAMLLTYSSPAQIKSANLTASGLTCSMCSKAIYKALLKIPSIQKVDVDIEKSSYLITFKPGSDVSPVSLRKAVEGAGFSVALLRLVANLPEMNIGSDTKFIIQGSQYRVLNAPKTALSGEQTFTVVEKNYLPASEYRKWEKSIPTKKDQVYHVIL